MERVDSLAQTTKYAEVQPMDLTVQANKYVLKNIFNLKLKIFQKTADLKATNNQWRVKESGKLIKLHGSEKE